MLTRTAPARFVILSLAIITLTLAASVVYAQALIVIITPPSGPPGTVFSITTSGGGFEGFPVECTVNGASVGTFDYYGVYQNYQVPFDAAPGAVFTIYCYQPTVPDSGPLAGTAFFTVTVADADGDGIPDGQDACPQEFAQTPSGCPDSDGDGLIDGQDSCPFEFGQTPNGCPDSDGDGIPDGQDSCPQTFGQTPSGCPDSDGDGLIDAQDSCPFEFAQTANGCPLPTETPIPTATALPTSTPTATLQAATLPPAPTALPVTQAAGGFVRAAAAEFAQFAECTNIYQQAAGISITEMIRISVTDNPCASLTEALRRQRFGNVNLPSPLSQPRSGELRCTTDPRSVPSADFMWLDGNYARFGSQIRLNWAGVSDAELCAAQAGDPFRLAAVRGIAPALERAEYYTGVCYGILTGAQMREAMARLRAGADAEVATLLISSLSTSSRLVGQLVWCSYLQRRILNISQADIDQQNALLNRLVECRVIQSAEVDIWRARINEGQAGFTWNDLAAYFGYLGSRCMSGFDFTLFIANRGAFLTAQTSLQLPVATIAPVQQLFELGTAPDIIQLLGPLETTTQTTEIARCPTDTRSLPTPEMQALLNGINQLSNGVFDPNRSATGVLADGTTTLNLFLSSLSESGICAIMRGDPFGLLGGITMPSDRMRNLLWTTTCLGGSYPAAEYSFVLQVRVDTDSRTPGVIAAVNAASTPAEKSRLWCAHVNALIEEIPPLPITPAQQASLDYLGQCLNYGRPQLAALYALFTGGASFNDVPFFGGRTPGGLLSAPITFEQFITLIDEWRATYPNRCPTPAELIAQIEQIASNRVITEISATAALSETSVAVGIVHEVICNRQSLSFVVSGRTPQGCVARDGGRFLEANTTRDSYEAGIAGVEVTIYRGGCNDLGGALIGTATTNGDGLFELGRLQSIPHCLSIDLASGPNLAALGEGQWWTFAGVGGTHLWFTFTPGSATVGSIIPIPSFGWWRAQESGVTTRMGTEGEMLSSAADTIIATYDPGLWPGADTSLGELTTPEPGTIPFAINVFRAYCEPDGWDGTLANVPPGCAIRADGRLIPDVDQQLVRGAPPNNYDEPGVPGITVAVYVGNCDADPPEYVFVTGPDGLARGRLPSSPEGIDYCIYADAGLPSNSEALGVGRWVHTPYVESVSRIAISDGFRLGLTHVLQWWLTGTGVPSDDSPIPTPPPPPGGSGSGSGSGFDPGRAAAPGLIPIIPVRDVAACVPGSACVPVITVGRPGAPNAVVAPPRPPSAGAVLAVPPPPSLPDPLTVGVFDAAIGTGWRTAVIDTTERAVFVGQTTSDAPPNLFLLEGSGIFDIGQGSSVSEHGASLSPDGQMLAFIGRDAGGIGTLYLFDVESGAYRSLFRDGLGTSLSNDTIAWDDDGRTVYFTAESVDGSTDIYQLAVDAPGTIPELFLADAGQPSLTPDGLLMAFVRGGAIYVRFLDTGDEYPLTEPEAGSACVSPFFDANGLDLYFICGQDQEARLYRHGAAGLEAITLSVAPLLTAGAGPVSQSLLIGDGTTLYLAADDGSNALPFIQLPDLRVQALYWGG